jgi:Tol biopolymer transport system component
MDLKGRCCIHQVDVETGHVSPAIVQERVPDGEGLDQPAWTANGKGILYVRGSKMIVSRDLRTGADTMLLDIRSVGIDRLMPGGNGNPSFAISPDGRSIAFSGWIGTGAEALSVIDVLQLGGTAAELLRAPEPLLFQGWTPDGLDLLFARPKSRGDKVNALWRIPAVGGPPRPVGLEMIGLRDVHISPDGARLTFTAGWQTGDVRMMENLLPR